MKSLSFHEFVAQELDIPAEETQTVGLTYKNLNQEEQQVLRKKWDSHQEKVGVWKEEGKTRKIKTPTKKEQQTLSKMGFEIDLKDITERFVKQNPIFYDRAGLWWVWSEQKSCWELTDETDILIAIDNAIQINGSLKSGTKAELLEGLRRAGRKIEPKTPPKTWIQFRNGVYDLNTKTTHKATPEYLFTNPIPHNLGEKKETPELNKVFAEWVGEDKVILLKQIASYCMLADYPIHRFFVLIGRGLNGKGSFLRWLAKLIGETNTVSTELDGLMRSRFESAKLYKKLLCQLGETNFNTLRNTSLLKKLTGGDLIGFEFKNKMPFDAYNYAKIVIATNSLPLTEDRTDGFYRRPLIINFDTRFTEKRDIDTEIQKEEFYEAFCRQAVEILSELIKEREFAGEGTIEDRRDRYEEASNPIGRFIRECCKEGNNEYVSSGAFYDSISVWADKLGYREMSHQEVSKAIKAHGFEIKPKKIDGNNVRCVLGVSIDKVTQVTEVTPISTRSHAYEKQVKTGVTAVTSVTGGLEAFYDYNSLENKNLQPDDLSDGLVSLCPHGNYPDEGCLFCEKESQGISGGQYD